MHLYCCRHKTHSGPMPNMYTKQCFSINARRCQSPQGLRDAYRGFGVIPAGVENVKIHRSSSGPPYSMSHDPYMHENQRQGNMLAPSSMTPAKKGSRALYAFTESIIGICEDSV